jgi:hypothetical protein
MEPSAAAVLRETIEACFGREAAYDRFRVVAIVVERPSTRWSVHPRRYGPEAGLRLADYTLVQVAAPMPQGWTEYELAALHLYCGLPLPLALLPRPGLPYPFAYAAEWGAMAEHAAYRRWVINERFYLQLLPPPPLPASPSLPVPVAFPSASKTYAEATARPTCHPRRKHAGEMPSTPVST